MSDLNITVTMTTRTCSCGAFYALPHWITSNHRCPMCADRRYDALYERVCKMEEEEERLGRVIRGLRGALKQRAVRK